MGCPGQHTIYTQLAHLPLPHQQVPTTITMSSEPGHSNENHLKADGTPDHRFKEVRHVTTGSSGLIIY